MKFESKFGALHGPRFEEGSTIKAMLVQCAASCLLSSASTYIRLLPSFPLEGRGESMSDVPIRQRPLSLLHQPPHRAPPRENPVRCRACGCSAGEGCRLKSSLKVATLLSLKWLLVEVKMAIWDVTYAVLRERTLTRHGNTKTQPNLKRY